MHRLALALTRGFSKHESTTIRKIRRSAAFKPRLSPCDKLWPRLILLPYSPFILNNSALLNIPARRADILL
jgi:hypothetical protein